jgi:hypothetical protein
MSDRDATADWLISTHGRIARIVAGSLLIILGRGIIGGVLGVLLLIIGAVPIASAAYGTFLPLRRAGVVGMSSPTPTLPRHEPPRQRPRRLHLALEGRQAEAALITRTLHIAK